MGERVAEITNRYAKDRKPSDFIRGLGIPVRRQTVGYWKRGQQEPSQLTLLRVLSNPNSATWARQWAGEVMAVQLAQLSARQQNDQE